MSGWREEILPLARGFGLLTLPAHERPRSAVVLLNAGLIHRVGPFRLHVRLARTLAAEGCAVLRYDQAGIGDSLASADVAEVDALRDVLDRVQARTGCTRFVAGGLCSAADLAWQLALADARVRGLLLLDGWAPGGAWLLLGRVRHLLRQPLRRWPGIVLRRLRRDTPHEPADAELRDWPRPDRARAQMRELLARGVRCFALYTGGAARYFLHPRQCRATFASAAPGQVELGWWRHCDHLFYSEASRARLLDAVRAWIARDRDMTGAAT
jgi:hypothetical protein